MKIINETPRKVLRYLMFTKKNKVNLDKPVVGKKEDKDIVNYFEEQKEFTNWDDFEIKWDIGIGDDTIAKANREEKWFLFDKPKDQIIERPKNYWEEEAKRCKTSTHSLFVKECNHRNITINEFFKLFF